MIFIILNTVGYIFWCIDIPLANFTFSLLGLYYCKVIFIYCYSGYVNLYVLSLVLTTSKGVVGSVAARQANAAEKLYQSVESFSLISNLFLIYSYIGNITETKGTFIE